MSTSCNKPGPSFDGHEHLDIVDPFHHLASADDPDEDLLPAQPPSIHDQIIQLNIPLLDTDESPRTMSLSLAVNAGAGCGGIAWPAGEVLARYIARRGKALQGLNVLELGSGTGLVGLVAGYFGAQVYITDQASLVPIMERNIALNGLTCVTAAELDWYVVSTPARLTSHLLPGQNRYPSTSHDLTSFLPPIAYTSSLRFRCS